METDEIETQNKSNTETQTLSDAETVELLKGHSSKINCALTTHDNNTVITCGGSGSFGDKDNTIRVWSLKNLVQESVLKDHQDRVTCLVLSSDDNYLYSGSYDKTVICWNFTNKKHEYTLKSHNSYIIALDITQNGKYLASVGVKDSIIIWNLTNQTADYIHKISGLFRHIFFIEEFQSLFSLSIIGEPLFIKFDFSGPPNQNFYIPQPLPKKNYYITSNFSLIRAREE